MRPALPSPPRQPTGPAPGHRAHPARLRQQPVGASSDKAWAFDANLWEVLRHSGLPTDRDELQALAGNSIHGRPPGLGVDGARWMDLVASGAERRSAWGGGRAMAGPGRNDRCPCGSGRKVKRCCGVRRGPSEDELAKAFLAVEARIAGGVLEDADQEELAGLVEELGGLPATDGTLRWPLPRLWTPELDRLGAALAEEDLEAVRASLPVVLQRLDTPGGRARLARAVLERRDVGAVDAKLAAAAIIDLACASTTLVRASVLEAVAVDAGALPTAGGLIVPGR